MEDNFQREATTRDSKRGQSGNTVIRDPRILCTPLSKFLDPRQLSWPRFLTLSRTCDAMQVSLLQSLSVKWYICLSRNSNPVSYDPEALSWTKRGSNFSVWFVWRERPVHCAHPLCYCCCLFGFNVAINNFSVISWRCLVETGSSMLTFIVLRYWSIMPQTLDMIPHPVTLSWHCLDQSYLFHVSLSAKREAASTIFKDFGISWPGIEPVNSWFPERTLYRLSYRGR